MFLIKFEGLVRLLDLMLCLSFSEAATALTIGDEIVTIDGHEINLHSLTILALQGAGKKTSDNLTTASVVRNMLQGSRGSLLTLIIKRQGAQSDKLAAKKAVAVPILIATPTPNDTELSATPLSADISAVSKTKKKRQGVKPVKSQCRMQ